MSSTSRFLECGPLGHQPRDKVGRLSLYWELKPERYFSEMEFQQQTTLTQHEDINEVLHALTTGIQGVLDDTLIGVYLFGSLTYGDFDRGRSDIDLVTIITRPVSPETLALIARLHQRVEQQHVGWARRVECSYVPMAMLTEVLPPKDPRPYYGGEGVLYPEAPYGNEWIINNYLLREHGIALIGPDCRTLIPPIDMVDVQIASLRDLFTEWEPKLADPGWLDNSHYQSYLVLNLCRILYTVLAGSAGSKSIAARWVRTNFGQWKVLIDTAQNWRYGDAMARQTEVAAFIAFAIDRVKATPLFAQHGVS